MLDREPRVWRMMRKMGTRGSQRASTVPSILAAAPLTVACMHPHT